MEMRKGISIFKLLVSIPCLIKYIIILALSHIGLCDPPKDAIYAGERTTVTLQSTNKDYILMQDGPSLVAVPTQAIIDSIKKKLPVLRYGNYCEKIVISGNNNTCVVCWDSIEMNEEVRELCNCDHVFHRDCLDTWVDEGHVTCPLCRSMLLPSNINPYMLLRTYYHHQKKHQLENESLR